MIQRMMMRYLRKRGWIVFWLDEPAQFCVSRSDDTASRVVQHDGCWLWLYLYDKRKASTPQSN